MYSTESQYSKIQDRLETLDTKDQYLVTRIVLKPLIDQIWTGMNRINLLQSRWQQLQVYKEDRLSLKLSSYDLRAI